VRPGRPHGSSACNSPGQRRSCVYGYAVRSTARSRVAPPIFRIGLAQCTIVGGGGLSPPCKPPRNGHSTFYHSRGAGCFGLSPPCSLRNYIAMMRRQQSQENSSEGIDDHDAPTEPMAQVILSPFSSTTSYSNGSNGLNGGSPAGAAVPTPEPFEQPFPQQGHPDYVQPGSFYRPPGAQAYPVLPPAPFAGKTRPAGGAAPIPADSSALPTRLKSAQAHRSSFPVWVGVFLVAVQLLLLIRFVLQLISYSTSSTWVSLIYTVSNAFILPFRALLYSLTASLSISSDLFDLLAIIFAVLMYGLLSRILVRFLKALLNSR
jgi:hypothetical protein